MAASRLQTSTPTHPAVSAAPATSTQMMIVDKSGLQLHAGKQGCAVLVAVQQGAAPD
jgi:hypothetical protein